MVNKSIDFFFYTFRVLVAKTVVFKKKCVFPSNGLVLSGSYLVAFVEYNATERLIRYFENYVSYFVQNQRKYILFNRISIYVK